MNKRSALKWFIFPGLLMLLFVLGDRGIQISLAGENTPTPNPLQKQELDMIDSAQQMLTQ